jgi:hypothetical protein
MTLLTNKQHFDYTQLI